MADERKKATPKAIKDKDNKVERISMRMYPEDYRKLVYWSELFDMDKTELLVTAMHHYIKWRNEDFDLPTAEIQRLNQMIDAVQNLASRQENLEKSVTAGFDAMLGLVRGDNYLVEKEDGEL